MLGGIIGFMKEQCAMGEQGKRSALEDRLWQALHDVDDPEFDMNIVDMGLVYGVKADMGRVKIDLTFTAMGCPAMEYILEDVEKRLLAEDDVETVDINIVWSPPWTKDRLSEVGRQSLLDWGIST
jgi:metal-sulfur cluster biosynthetic enzyme